MSLFSRSKKENKVDLFSEPPLSDLPVSAIKLMKRSGIDPEDGATHFLVLLRCLYHDLRQEPETAEKMRSLILEQKQNATRTVPRKKARKSSKAEHKVLSSSAALKTKTPKTPKTPKTKKVKDAADTKSKDKESSGNMSIVFGSEESASTHSLTLTEGETFSPLSSPHQEKSIAPKRKRHKRSPKKDDDVDDDDGLFLHEDPQSYLTYRIRVGSGSFGDVYTGRDKISNTKVAIKVIKTSYEENKESINNEVKMLRSCQHPNIVNYLRSYLWKDKAWLVTEYCDAGTLGKLIASKDLSEGVIVAILKQVLSGLHYLHSRNRIHRDIKSENILLDLNGNVKLADLGLCADVDRKRKSVAGTRYWMAPEMIRHLPYGCKVDIWSTGATVMEMAEKNPPYYSYKLPKANFLTATQGAPPLKKPKKWSPEFKDLLSRCFEMDPTERPSADDLLQHPLMRKASSTNKLSQMIAAVFVGASLRSTGL